MKKVTLADIAKKTGYSVNTVSHALRDMKDISKDVKKYINDTAIEVGYIPNISAGALRGGKTRSIAIIVKDIADVSTALVIKEMEALLCKKGYSTFVMGTDNDEKTEQSAITRAISRNVDGIIISPVLKTKKSISFLKESSTPFLFLGKESRAHPFVSADNEKAYKMASEHLSSYGHEHILFINSDNADECKNYSAVITEDFISFAELVNTLKKSEKKIPEDISVVSLAEIPFDYPVKVTSVVVPSYVIATEAVTTILAMINGEEFTISNAVTPELVEGESVAEPSKKFTRASRKQLSDYLL